MNVQDYISSGIVESCMLGLASHEEHEGFEKMCNQHSEVLQARLDFELSMELHAMQNAVSPPPALKQQIMDTIFHFEAKVIPINADAPVIKTNWLKYAAAACAVLLAASGYWNFSQNKSNKKLLANYDKTVAKLRDLEKDLAMVVQNPNVKMAAMKGLEASPASFATVYWDTTSKDVYLQINNLPKPVSEKQYQLWALFDGKPIDVGMIENDSFTGEKKLLLQMKNVGGAQAFAITLEKKGGNLTPQGSMYVLGNL